MIRNVDENFAENRSIREELLSVLNEIGSDRAEQKVEGEGWTIAQTAMHVAAVESGIIRICAKLLGKAEAEGALSDDGTIRLSDDFLQRMNGIETEKLEAPERVRPAEDVSLKDALKALGENVESFDSLLPKFLEFSSDAGTFPHPYLGGLNAGEWLSLSGAHAARHMKQIRRIESKLA